MFDGGTARRMPAGRWQLRLAGQQPRIAMGAEPVLLDALATVQSGGRDVAAAIARYCRRVLPTIHTAVVDNLARRLSTLLSVDAEEAAGLAVDLEVVILTLQAVLRALMSRAGAEDEDAWQVAEDAAVLLADLGRVLVGSDLSTSAGPGHPLVGLRTGARPGHPRPARAPLDLHPLLRQ